MSLNEILATTLACGALIYIMGIYVWDWWDRKKTN